MQKHPTVTIIPREKHSVSRDNISPNALKVMTRLHESGFAAYLVGGSVRDLLLGKKPKDFDIATNAQPDEIKQLFRNCILIGRRFRLAHIRFGREIIEVATFRADHSKAMSDEARSVGGMIIRDNVYGTLEEDAWRRDFTINALYYNIADASVVDYCGGMADLKKQQICIIGDPVQRYQEDPVRLLRAIRFAASCNFSIEKETASPIREMGYLLHQISPSRLFEESLKLFMKGHAAKTFEMSLQYDLLKELFPSTTHCLLHLQESPLKQFLTLAMHNSDDRIAQGKTVTPVFLLAVLLWYPLLQEIEYEKQQFLPKNTAIDNAIRHMLRKQQLLTTIPRRLSGGMTDIWKLQFRFTNKSRRSVAKNVSHPRFRAAYDFLLLRAEAGEDVSELAKWWADFYNADNHQRNTLLTDTLVK